jgi:hypothetical protein
MVNPVGPIYAAGFQQITKGGYTLLYLPDLHNDDLQRSGQPSVYYWLSNEVCLARDSVTGNYKFHMTNFVGVQSSDTTVGVEPGETREEAGGIIAFSTTSAPPPEVLQQAEEELLNRFRGSDDKYWGWRTPIAPMFRPVPILDNQTSITNLSPLPNGSVPVVAPPAPGRSLNRSAAPQITASRRMPLMRSPRTITTGQALRKARTLDAWYVNLQGQGAGSVNPFAENAYSGLMGSYPAAILYSSFHAEYSDIAVWQHLKLKVWAPAARLYMKGSWERIQTHFSGAAHAGGLFWSADIKAEFNNLVISGGIEAKIEIDRTLPNADKLEEEMNKRSDLLYQKFMEQAQKVIFEPAPFQEEAAQASGGFLGFGGGAAFKVRRDRVSLELHIDETREIAYIQDYPISSPLRGFYDEIKADPQAEKKYFTTLYLDDWNRKVTFTFKPIVNWPEPGKQWAGQPVAFLSAQMGYPNTEGVIQWESEIFSATDPIDKFFAPAAAQKKAVDVNNPPAGWASDKAFVKRQIHFAEPPTEAEFPFSRLYVEKNIVDLDPGENGTLTNTLNQEIRVDSAGVLSVGPITLNVDLETPKQIVEVSFQALGKTDEGYDRPITKFTWNYDDQTEPRYLAIYTGQPGFVPKYQYQVRVLVKGSIFTKGMEWIGSWQEAGGNGPLMVSVPTPDDPGVTKRSMIPLTRPAAAQGTGKPPVASGNGGGKPPATVGNGMGRPPVPPPPALGQGAPPPATRTVRSIAPEAEPEPERELVAGWSTKSPDA